MKPNFLNYNQNKKGEKASRKLESIPLKSSSIKK